MTSHYFKSSIEWLYGFWTKSISRQLMLGIALVHAVLMSIFVLDLVDRERQFLLDTSQNQAIGLAQTLAANGRSWVLSNDVIGIEEVVLSQSGFPGLRYAMFLNTDGHVLGHTELENVGFYIDDPISRRLLNLEIETQILVNQSNLIDIAVPMFFAEKHIGWARVGISREGIIDNLTAVTRNGLYYTLFAIMVGLLFAWVMSRGLTIDIRRLGEMMYQVQQGQRHINFKLKRKDELGRLSGDISSTIETLGRAESNLNTQYERSRVTLRSIGDGVITTYADGSIEYINPVAERLTGWKSQEAMGKMLPEVFPITNELTGEIIENPVDKVLSSNLVVALANHTILQHRNGSKLSIEDSAAPIHDDNKNIMGVVLVFHDATDERALHEKMAYQASHDALTGLWNRTAFEQKLGELQSDSDHNSSTHALLYIDLDQFKVVNDTAGHIAGDELLRQVSLELSSIVRGSDMLARLGGDEFGVLLHHCDEDHAAYVSEKIRQVIEEYGFSWEDNRYKIGTSIGIAMITINTRSHEVLSNADIACYAAKDQGRNRVHIYNLDDAYLSERVGEMHWISTINDALKNEKFVLYYQNIHPIMTRANTEYREILVRLLDDEGEIILPNAFIPSAERYELMASIDTFVLDKACEWLSQQPENEYRLSVNLSGSSLGNKQFLSDIEEKFKTSPQLAKNICLEITETSAISNLRSAISFMERLNSLGVKFSLDDFGSGLSSFAYLKNMPVSTLKIDGCFVRDMTNDPIDAAMVQAIAQVSQKLGLNTVAEFVEDEATLNLLAEYGVNFAQGYHIHKPELLIFS